MANIQLINTSNAMGVYEGVDMNLESTQAAIVDLIDDIEMTFVAAKRKWADKKANKYTATITNTGTIPFDLDEDSVIKYSTDAFDTDSVEIDEDSIAVTGNTPGTVAVTDGVVSVELTVAIDNATPTVITFDVYKKGTMPVPEP